MVKKNSKQRPRFEHIPPPDQTEYEKTGKNRFTQLGKNPRPKNKGRASGLGVRHRKKGNEKR